MTLSQGARNPLDSNAHETPTVEVAAIAETAGLPECLALPQEILKAIQRAESILAQSEVRARQLLAEAERAAAEISLGAELRGRAQGAAQLAAQALAFAHRFARADQQALERSIDLARILAERLLGETLTLDPSRIVALARQVLRDEARGLRSVTVVAHPLDARELEQSLIALDFEMSSVRLIADPRQGRGNLRLVTDCAELDAGIAPRLDGLTDVLREILSK